MTKILIIGGMAAGCKAAAHLRRLGSEYDITIIERSSFLSVSACGLPFFASGDVEDFKELISTSYGSVRDDSYFRNEKNIKALTNTEVLSINPEKKQLIALNLKTKEESVYYYDKLLIATGSQAMRTPFEIPQSDRISNFLSANDAIAFKQLAERGKIGSVAIIGGGFIGCELAEAMVSMWGIETYLFEKENHLLPRCLDNEIASVFENLLKSKDVIIHLNTVINRIDEEAGQLKVLSSSGNSPLVDYVFLCLGVKPNTFLAESCGVTLGDYKGILVDDTLKTSVEDIFAAGDCIEVKYFITGKKGVFPFGSLANRQGRVVAENMAGNKVTFKGAVAAASVKVFDTVLAVCGMSETEAHRNGIECKSVIGLFSDRPDFHPDSKDITAVLVYEVGTLRLIGFQAIGQGEVTRLVDAFSILASKSATALDLLEFEHAYTPPHSPPMNVLNHLGSMAIAQETRNIKCMKISELSAFKGTIIDVRKPDEIAEYPLQQPSIHIPLHEIYMRKQEVPSSMPLLFVCQKGVRSHEAACSFKNAGWEDVSYLGGGILLKNSICHFQA